MGEALVDPGCHLSGEYMEVTMTGEITHPAKGIILLLLTAGCGPAGAPPLMTRSDSAGVAIVRYDALPDAASSRITLSEEPVMTLGGAGSAPEQGFFQVAGVVRLSDGRIVVGDRGSGELRYFDPGGILLGKSGGAGDGPGEFRRLTFIGRTTGDSVVTGDAVLGRFQVFDPQGRYARGMSATEVGRGVWGGRAVGVTARGRILATQYTPPTAGNEKPERAPYPLLLLDPARNNWDTLAVLRGPGQLIRATERGFLMEGVTYGGQSDASAGDDVVAAVDTDVLGAQVFRGGKLVAVLRVAHAPVPVTPDLLARYAEEAMSLWPAGMSDESRNAFRQRVMTGPHGASLPLVVSVEVDAMGRVWLNRGRMPGEPREFFAVFSPEGEWLAEITMPPGLDRGTEGSNGPGMDIGRDYLLGVWRDELGVETIRMYRLTDK